MKSRAIHFDGQPDYLQRMKVVHLAGLRPPLTWADRILGVLMVPVIVVVLVALYSGLWLCAKAGWMEER